MKIQYTKYFLPLYLFFSIAPVLLGKVGIILITGLLGIKLISNIRTELYPKAAIISLLVPGLILAVIYSSQDVIRFMPIIFLVLLYPYRFIRIDANLIQRACILTIAYLFLTQILIAIGYDPVVQFRSQWYEIPGSSHIYGYADNLTYGFREFRAGGLYYNPNVYASVLIFVYFIFLYSKSQVMTSVSGSARHTHNFNAKMALVTSVVLFSLYLAGSRTYLVVFFVFLFLEFRHLILKSKIIFTIIGFIFIFIFIEVYEVVIGAFVSNQGSVNIKFSILNDYIYRQNYVLLLTGSSTTTFFDSEYGNWIGRSGFFGLMAIILFYGLVFIRSRSLFPLLLSLMLMGIGNTVLYGMLTATLVIVVFVVSIGRKNTCEKFKR